MGKEERARACYWHACLKYVQREAVTNASIRERFGIEAHNAAMASRLIKDAVEAGLLAPFDASAPKQQMRYLPWWARPDGSARGEAP
jgi:ATP-dependent DNA helicase RecG